MAILTRGPAVPARQGAPARGCRLGTVALLLVLALSSAVRAASQPGRVAEDEAKAAFLFNFVRFVRWPAERLPPEAPIVVGMVGAHGLAEVLDRAVAGRTVDGHPVSVRTLADSVEAARSHVVFVGEPGMAGFARMRSALDEARSVLLVGDAPDFLLHGGMIALFVE